jgi:hypothetical protein
MYSAIMIESPMLFSCWWVCDAFWYFSLTRTHTPQGGALHSDEERRPGGDEESDESEEEDRKVRTLPSLWFPKRKSGFKEQTLPRATQLRIL